MENEHFADGLDSLLDSNIVSESDIKQDVTAEQDSYTDNLETNDDEICETINFQIYFSIIIIMKLMCLSILKL